MAITISGENNNDRITAQDGVIDTISGFNIAGIITASSFTGDLTGNVTGNLTGNVNSTSPLLLQTGGSERFRITGNNELGIAGANYGSAGQVLTSGGSGSAVTWSAIPSQVNIANNADNRVITGGSGTNLNGEAALTFDGQTLTISAPTNDTPLILDTGSSNGSHLRFQKDGANKHFIGSGGGIGLGDIDDLALRTVDNIIFGVGTSEKLRITSTGLIRMGNGAQANTESHITAAIFQNVSGTATILKLGNTNTPSSANNRAIEFCDGTGGTEGSSKYTYARIKAERTGGSNAGRLIFSTKPNNSDGPQKAFEITPDGDVLIGNGGVTTQEGDGRLIVYANTRLHPAIKADCIDGGSNRANGYTMLADNYQADESLTNIGVSYSGGGLVLSRGVKVSNTADNAYLSSVDSFATQPCALKLDNGGNLTFSSTNTSATTTTDSAVTLHERFRIMANGRMGVGNNNPQFVIHTEGSGNNGGVRLENSHTTTTVSGNTAAGAFPHNLILSNYGGSGNADNRLVSLGFDIPTTVSHANAQIVYQATGSNGVGDLQFWLENGNTSYERARFTAAGQFVMGTTSSTGARVIIQQNSSDTNFSDQQTCADSSGMRLHNYSFSTGRYTALSMECCNSSSVQSASIIAQSSASGTSPNIIITQRNSNTTNKERLRITPQGYREIRNYHYGPFPFVNNTYKSTITVGDPGDGKHTTIKFILTLEDVGYRQGFWQGEFVIWSSNSNGGPGVSHIYKKIWDNIGSTNWNGGTVVYQMSGGAFQFKASNDNSDAAGNAYIHILDVIGDIDGSTVASISS